MAWENEYTERDGARADLQIIHLKLEDKPLSFHQEK
jgi:hypothetical protein